MTSSLTKMMDVVAARSVEYMVLTVPFSWSTGMRSANIVDIMLALACTRPTVPTEAQSKQNEDECGYMLIPRIIAL